MRIFGAAHGWNGRRGGQNLSRISYNNETCYSYTLPKGGPTIIQITYHTP